MKTPVLLELLRAAKRRLEEPLVPFPFQRCRKCLYIHSCDDVCCEIEDEALALAEPARELARELDDVIFELERSARAESAQ